jgi:antitoxin MazE
MNQVIKTRLVKIGNSQGIRIPRALLEQVGLGEDIELEVRGDHLLLRAAWRPRAGWDTQFRQMAAAGDDELLDPELLPDADWDAEEWTWE